LVDDRTTTSDTAIYAGEPVKIYGEEDGNYVYHLATGDPEIGTDIMVGITASDSTETATANGSVEVYLPLPGIIYRCKATTPANLAEGIILDTVCFDLTSTTYTVDENEGSDENVHGLRIMGYDTTQGTVDFIIKSEAKILDCMIS
jgi:hypothetical protein